MGTAGRREGLSWPARRTEPAMRVLKARQALYTLPQLDTVGLIISSFCEVNHTFHAAQSNGPRTRHTTRR